MSGCVTEDEHLVATCIYNSFKVLYNFVSKPMTVFVLNGVASVANYYFPLIGGQMFYKYTGS